jgi:hypothetical protein
MPSGAARQCDGGTAATRRRRQPVVVVRAVEDCPARPSNRRVGALSAVRAMQKTRTKPIHCGEREGRLNAAGGPGQ